MNDNQTAAILIGDGAVRGRVIRLGAALDKALGVERYPTPVAGILGEAVLIAALVARSLKFDGKLLVQAHGTNEGAVSMVVAESTTSGHVRGYARFDPTSLARILSDHKVPDAQTLMGGGTFAMTIDPDGDRERYQGLAAIEGAHLADCAEHYFARSEQIPTRLRLAVGQVQVPEQDPQWRGGGLMVQRIAGDATRGDTDDIWELSKAVMGTLGDDELLDPALSADDLLYRLFHEIGVRRLEPQDVQAKCSCSKSRLLATLKTFDEAARNDMFEDGKISANCEFCDADYVFTAQDF